MDVTADSADAVTVRHPRAGLRISVFVEKRAKTGSAKVKPFLEAFKAGLKKEMKKSRILKEGKLRGAEDSQAYVVCSFTDKRGLRLVQLVQYYVTEDRLLQMIISDRPEGFRNLEPIIEEIHGSLRIHEPSLKRGPAHKR